MKVVFVTDYLAIGKKNEIKEVKDGFALNFLIPQKIAVKATPDKIQLAAEQKAKEVKNVQTSKLTKDKWLNVLKTVKLVLTGKANEHGHLYSQVNGKLIQEKLKEQFGINLTDSSFKLVEPIKILGEHVVQLKIENSLVNLKIKIIHE